MARKRTSRRRGSRRSIVTSVRGRPEFRSRSGSAAARRQGYYLHYRTPGGSKKLKRLGRTETQAGDALDDWRRKVRGKGYRVLKVFMARDMRMARIRVAPVKRRR